MFLSWLFTIPFGYKLILAQIWAAFTLFFFSGEQHNVYPPKMHTFKTTELLNVGQNLEILLDEGLQRAPTWLTVLPMG